MAQIPREAGRPVFTDYGRLSASCKTALHQFQTGEMVHAYLLTGARGLGKRTFARLLASALFCTSETGEKPCGVCEGCRRVWDDNEPDVISLFADDGKQIGVDRVRDVIRAVGQHSFGTGYRVVLIEPVEKMTPQAQNCLLKSLEEPVARVVFLLMTHELTATLGTIASRCARIKMRPWPDALMTETLTQMGCDPARIPTAVGLAGGNIGMALEVLNGDGLEEKDREFLTDALSLQSDADVLKVSTRLKDQRETADQYLILLENALHQALLAKAGLLPEGALAQYPATWRACLPQADEAGLNRMLDAVFLARKRRAGQVNWQSTVDQLMMTILEEQKTWQQS